jgi:hypothetical protein
MRFAKGALIGIGAVPLFASLLNLVAPKAVHAAVAALVQVSNTVSTPAITQNVSALASQNVNLFCIPESDCAAVPPSGVIIAPTNSLPTYTVPAGQTLVITNVEVGSIGGGGLAQFGINTGGTCITPPDFCVSPTWNFPNDGRTHEFQFPPGILWSSGSKLQVFANNLSSAWVRGYLTSN